MSVEWTTVQVLAVEGVVQGPGTGTGRPQV
jgi:hypothetical protein